MPDCESHLQQVITAKGALLGTEILDMWGLNNLETAAVIKNSICAQDGETTCDVNSIRVFKLFVFNVLSQTASSLYILPVNQICNDHSNLNRSHVSFQLIKQ